MRTVFALFLFSLFITGCAASKAYKSAKATQYIPAYENYISRYPGDKHAEAAKKELNNLYDERDWKKITDSKYVFQYENYLKKYPLGNHAVEAQEKINVLKEQAAWKKAGETNTIAAYENFLRDFPKSENSTEANTRIAKMKDEAAWKNADSLQAVATFKKYRDDFPSGAHVKDAEAKIAAYDASLGDWSKAEKTNTVKTYEAFIAKHPQSPLASDARRGMEKIEAQDWEKAQKTNTLKGYHDFLSKYPNGLKKEDAERKIIDLEVGNIVNGKHNQMPPMQKDASGNKVKLDYSEVELYNNTDYQLTLRYSGPDSKKVVLASQEKKTVRLKNGSYVIAASVNAAKVDNYVSYENMEGMLYKSQYYIKTYKFPTFDLDIPH